MPGQAGSDALAAEGNSADANADANANANANANADANAATTDKPWFETAGVDPRFHDTIKAKGWKGVDDLAESYVNVEKLVSLERGGEADRIIVKPKADATPEEVKAFREKAGFTAPATVEDYGFTQEQLTAAPIIGDAAKWFHEAGVPKDVASAIVEKAIARDAELATEFTERTTQEYNTLQQQMGDKFGDFEEAGRRAFKASGLDADGINEIEKAIGTKAMMSMFAKFGEAMSEASAPTPGRTGTGQFTTTPEQAQGRIKTLQKDTEFQARLLSTNPEVRKAATREWEDLHKAAYPPAA